MGTLQPAPGRPHPSAGELPITPVQGSTSTMWQWLILPHVYLMGDLLLFHIWKTQCQCGLPGYCPGI